MFNITSIGILILAGGLGSRFQDKTKWVDKILYPLQDKPILMHIIDSVYEVFKNIVVVTKSNRIDKYKNIIGNKDVLVVSDEEDEFHPLIGIKSGIKYLKTNFIVVVAGDMPYLKPNVIQLLIKDAHIYDVVAPIWPNGVVETLLAVYKRRHLEKSVEFALRKAFNKPSDLMRSAYSLKFLSIEKFKEVDPKLRSFININKLDDLRLSERTLYTTKKNVNKYEIKHKKEHPYWAALKSYIESDFKNAFKYFAKEADLYKKLGWIHLELHALYDLLNLSNILNMDAGFLHRRIEEVHTIIGW